MIIQGLLIAFVVLFGLVFVAAGAAIVVGTSSLLWDRWGTFVSALQSRRWSTTTGKITRSVVTYSISRRSRVWAPVIRYTYSVGGGDFVSERFAFISPTKGATSAEGVARAVVERFPAGANVEVYYDPEKPSRATLDRDVPPVVAVTFLSLLALAFGSAVALYLGTKIVLGAFEDPPDLGELPSIHAQAGGLAVALGVFLLLVAGVRSVSRRERRRRELLRRLGAARPALAGEVRAGEPVVVTGRVEEHWQEEEEAAEGAGSEDEPDEKGLGGASALDLPFEDVPLVYYDVDVDWFRRTCFTKFAVRDSSGAVTVELDGAESTFLERRELPIEGNVERWLDEQRDDPNDPIPVTSRLLTIERIRKGDLVAVVGTAERKGGELVFGARSVDPSSLVVAEGSREEVLGRLKTRIRRTRALALFGGLLVAIGGILALFS